MSKAASSFEKSVFRCAGYWFSHVSPISSVNQQRNGRRVRLKCAMIRVFV